MQRQKINISGMTLVEILVAIFILLIVFSITFVMLFTGLRSWFISMDRLDIQQSARTGLESICTDLYKSRPGRVGSRDWDDIVINDLLLSAGNNIRCATLTLEQFSGMTQRSVDNYNQFVSVNLPPLIPGNPGFFWYTSFYHNGYFLHFDPQGPDERFLCVFIPGLGAGRQVGVPWSERAIAYFVDANGHLIKGIFRAGFNPPLSPVSTVAAVDIQSISFSGWYIDPSFPNGLRPLNPVNLTDTNPDIVDISITAAKTTVFGDNLSYTLNTRVFLRGATGDQYYF